MALSLIMLTRQVSSFQRVRLMRRLIYRSVGAQDTQVRTWRTQGTLWIYFEQPIILMGRLPMTRRASILDESQVAALVMPFQMLSQSRLNYAASNPLRNASNINKLFSLLLSSLHNALGVGQKSPSIHIPTCMH